VVPICPRGPPIPPDTACPTMRPTSKHYGAILAWIRSSSSATPPVSSSRVGTHSTIPTASRTVSSPTRAPEFGLAPADREFWAQFGDPAALAYYLDDPDCSVMDINILTFGTVPSGAGTALTPQRRPGRPADSNGNSRERERRRHDANCWCPTPRRCTSRRGSLQITYGIRMTVPSRSSE
jgi:hypothetical protein